MRGKITTLNKDGGFGFLIDEANTERFFHVSMLAQGVDFGELQDGNWVSFTPLMASKGARAVDVKLSEPPVEGD